MNKVIQIPERFEDYIFDWNYLNYLLIGGYGSGKSWATAFKLILKLLEEKRKILVCRKIGETLRESCYDLFCDILSDMNLLADENEKNKNKKGKVIATSSPMQIKFPNGSRIVFKGLDKKDKIKSIHGVSVIWMEECAEIPFEVFEELQLRARTNKTTIHFILTCNPIAKGNWVYTHFFKRKKEDGSEVIILDEKEFYKKKTIIKNDTYYHHSVPVDNSFLPDKYIKKLDELKDYDFYLYEVARLGKFGVLGLRVLPQFEIAKNAKEFKDAIRAIPDEYKFIGFDFGFATSYNAVIKVAVDTKNKWLYIYDEIYINHVTDDEMVNLSEMQRIKNEEKIIRADSAEPKTISYYRKQGFKIIGCKKYAGSRLENTRKVKRFKRIICSPKCKNAIMELQDLTYKKDNQGNLIYDEFNIDSHTFRIKALGVYKAMEKHGKAETLIRTEVLCGNSTTHVQRIGIEETKTSPRAIAI